MLILYVDDDDDDRTLFWDITKQIDSSIQIVVANSGQRAIELLNEEEWLCPDVVFVDINVPGMNGFETLGAIRGVSRLQNTKVVLYSTSLNYKPRRPFNDPNVEFLQKGKHHRGNQKTIANHSGESSVQKSALVCYLIKHLSYNQVSNIVVIMWLVVIDFTVELSILRRTLLPLASSFTCRRSITLS